MGMLRHSGIITAIPDSRSLYPLLPAQRAKRHMPPVISSKIESGNSAPGIIRLSLHQYSSPAILI